MGNPFPGPQPYRSEDSPLFFGRERLVDDLGDAVLSRRVLTVYGPSGAGKSSLLQAGVVPFLDREWDLRCVVVDSWPADQVRASGPADRVREVLCVALELGAIDSLDEALDRAFRRSDRPVLVVLDQLEQLLVHHEREVLQAFVDVLDDLERRRGLSLHVVLSLREDYLGRWNGLLEDHPRLTRHGYRVPRLTVGEITRAAVKTAAKAKVAQLWDGAVLQELVEGMAIPGQWKSDAAEVESAFVQIVCRVLFDRKDSLASLTEERERENVLRRMRRRLDEEETEEQDANRRLATGILEGYLNRILGGLGQDEKPTRELLEDHLITLSGARKVVILAALEEVWSSSRALQPILDLLEEARILRAQVHRNQTFYELGHDWLAVPIRDSAESKRMALAARRGRARRLLVLLILALAVLIAARADRAADTALAGQKRAVKLQQAADMQKHRAEFAVVGARVSQRNSERAEETALVAEELAEAAAEQMESERDVANVLRVRAADAANEAAGHAQTARLAEAAAAREALRARDILKMLAVRELQDDPTRALQFLRALERGAVLPQWPDQVHSLLQSARTADRGFGPVLDLEFAALTAVGTLADGGLVALDGTGALLRWTSESRIGEPWFAGPSHALAVSPDGINVAVGDTLGNVTVFSTDGRMAETRQAFDTRVSGLAWAPDSEKLAACSEGGQTGVLEPLGWRPGPSHEAAVLAVSWEADGARVVTGSADGVVKRWTRSTGQVVQTVRAPGGLYDLALGKHQRVMVAGAEGGLGHAGPGQERLQLTAQIPSASRLVAVAAHGDVTATATVDGWVRIQTGLGAMAVLRGQTFAGSRVDQLVFSADGRWLAGATRLGDLFLWRLTREGHLIEAQELRGHDGQAQAVAFTLDGLSLVTTDSTGEWRRWALERRSLGMVLRDAGGALIPGERVQALAFTGDGAAVQVELEDGVQVSRPIPARRAKLEPRGHGARAEYLKLQDLAEAGDEHRIVIARWPTSEEPEVPVTRSFALQGHWARVHMAVISDDGLWLVSASDDGTTRLWPLYTDDELSKLVRGSTQGCISVEDRTLFLLESEDRAEEQYLACCQAPGRVCP